MTRDEFMNLVYKELHSDGDNYRANRIIDAADYYAEENEPHWIPVTERLPEESYYDDSNYVDPSDSVLVFTRYKTYYISRYWGHRTTKGETSYVIPDWMDLDEYISDAVVAWMPLPKPYEMEGDMK